jgi:hypothetical protein
MYQRLPLQILSVSLLVMAAFVTSRAQSSPVLTSFDFRNGAQGWQAGFADYPPAYNQNDLYQLRAEMRSLPLELGVAGSGFYIQGSNHSDDLFMFLKRRLGPSEGIVAGQKYQLRFTIIFASNAQSMCGGVGGPPGEGVTLKAGGSPVEPLAVGDAFGLRMNVDKGNQAVGGPAASVTGNIANGLPCQPNTRPYVTIQREHLHTFEVTANESGELWLLVGTDSGFEALTALYYQRIDVQLIPVNGSAAPAPILLTDNNTERAVALDSVTLMREPFSIAAGHNFSSDQRTRIILFARNIELLPGEDASTLIVRAEDAQGRVYMLPVEFVGKVPNFDWLTQIVVKLPDEVGSADAVRVSISLRGVISNKATMAIKPGSTN